MNIKKVSLVLFSLALLAGILYFFWPKTAQVKNAPVSKDAVILAFGDSLVAGEGATRNNDLPSLLSAKLGQPVLNYGVSGDTTEMGIARLDVALEEEPGIVILLLGGNDFLRKIPRGKTFANLETIISEFQEQGAAVILLGVQSGVFGNGPEKEYASLAEKTRTGYVPNVLDGLFGDNRYMSDTIHPNDAGYAIMADRVYAEITKLYQE